MGLFFGNPCTHGSLCLAITCHWYGWAGFPSSTECWRWDTPEVCTPVSPSFPLWLWAKLWGCSPWSLGERLMGKTKELPLACVEHAPVWSLAIRRTGTYICTFFPDCLEIFRQLLATQRSQHQRKSGYRQEKNDFLNVFDPTNSSPGWPHYPVIQATFKNDSKLTFKILWQQWFGDLRDR